MNVLWMALLVAFLGGTFPSQEPEPVPRHDLTPEYLEQEAAFAASILCQEATVPDTLVAEVREVLRKVRASCPDVARLRVTFPWDFGSLNIDMREDLFDRIREYRGDWAEFDFQDPVLNDFRDRCPIARIKTLPIGNMMYLTNVQFKEASARRNLRVIVDQLNRSKAVVGATLNCRAGIANEIFVRRKGPQWRVAFRKGWGDIPSGAVHRRYWYFTVEGNQVTPVETLPHDAPKRPRLYLWGFPNRICVGIYRDLDEILRTTRNDAEAWKRAHALKAAGVLLKQDAFVEAGEDDSAAFLELRRQAAPRRDEILDMLLECLQDPEDEVREGAQWGLSKITRRHLGNDPGVWADHLGRPRKK